jgi:hypothetical protein
LLGLLHTFLVFMILWSLVMIVKTDPGYVSDEVFDLHGMRSVVREFKNEPKQLVWAMNKGHYERNALMGVNGG